jgi:hypothetical protein
MNTTGYNKGPRAVPPRIGTVRGPCDLKGYFEYLEGRGADWRRLQFDELAGFKPWLRLSRAQRQCDGILRAQHGEPQDRRGHEFLRVPRDTGCGSRR